MKKAFYLSVLLVTSSCASEEQEPSGLVTETVEGGASAGSSPVFPDRASLPETSDGVKLPWPDAGVDRLSERLWAARHLQIMKDAAVGAAAYAAELGIDSSTKSSASAGERLAGVDLFFLGDSLTEGWKFNRKVLRETFPQFVTVNAGVNSDGVQNMLWRVRSGELAAANPRLVVIMAGLNNLAQSTDEQVVLGLAQLVTEVRRASPSSRVLLLGLLPSGKSASHPRRRRIERINAALAGQADGSVVSFSNLNQNFVTQDGHERRDLYCRDGTHLNHAGYDAFAAALVGPVARALFLMSPEAPSQERTP